jgi:1,4-dihydroxy-6-naphthoate synthase
MSARVRRTLRLAHSPDPDDAFMWWPLARSGGSAAIDTGPFEFELVQDDIESLNQRAMAGELEITAMSCANYPRVRHLYALTSCGCSMGEGYGPKLVSRRPLKVEDLRRRDLALAIPGLSTTAWTAAQLMLEGSTPRAAVVPFDQIIDRVASGEFDAGLVIHEGQLTFAASGLHLVADLGQWWSGQTGLPLPLGVNAVRRDLENAGGDGTLAAISGVLQRSVRHALDCRKQSLDHARRFGRGIAMAQADEFVSMYVNHWTLDFGVRGRAAVARLLGEAHRAGLVPDPGEVDFVAPADAAQP